MPGPADIAGHAFAEFTRSMIHRLPAFLIRVGREWLGDPGE
jgi:hypothetical protein